MALDVAIPAVVLVLVTLMMRFPERYRRGMARLCSVKAETLPPFPRTAAIALFIFFGFVLVVALLHHINWR
jgi:hypothetical protein